MANQGFIPGSAVNPSTQVEISVSCRNLQDKDAFSKSDPMCVLYIKDARTGSYQEFGRTEMIKDTLNPDFVHKFVMNYYFEESQKLKFEIYDVDSPKQALSGHDFLGRLECSLGEIVGASSGRMDAKLQGSKGRGQIIVRAEEMSASKELLTLHFSGTKLDKKDFLGKSDPFLILYKANEDRSFTAVHKTEVIKNTLNPTWRPFQIPVAKLCNGDYDRTVKIECYDWDSDGSHDFIGDFTTNVRELTGKPNLSFELINQKKKAKKKSYKNSGQIHLLSVKKEIKPSFLDFLKGGTQLNFTVAIDFTGSNGNPASPHSLHYINPYQPNQYVAAIQAVGEIIQDYDSDKLFPVLGFGAKLPDGTVSHEFPVNFNPANPYVQGIAGILDAYQNAIRRVQLYGPTNFSPVINHVSKFAASVRDGSNYFVLLILTDGEITDMRNTIDAIVTASHLPLSIIIVGVGNADFSAMNVLDADDQRLCSNGKYAVRDIVQFVPFRDFLGGQSGGNTQISQAALAKEVLAEIPGQVVQYMQANKITPKPPRTDIVLPGQNPPQQNQGQNPPPPPPTQNQGPMPSWAKAPPGGPSAPPPASGGSCPYPQQGPW
ncbi:copine-8-like isoform X2 [Saccostrea echinata]|uniref:copine-8-like isoform X2 n=1 Tax=Saccostrea echinata TaxID=191078 RepID=UPI002A82E271|nr:copine-8-like isoform X2 [Saccostrea echinata]